MLLSRPLIRVGSLSVPGKVRLANEDAFYCSDTMGLFVIADGLGGLPSGEAASQIAVHGLARLMEMALNHPAISEKVSLGALLRDSFTVLNRHMYQHSLASPALGGMATTVVAMVYQGKVAHIVHAGDSRAYLIRAGRCTQITQDHTKRLPSKPKGQALLTQYMVMPGDVATDINSFALQPGDRILMATDGLSGPIGKDAIEKIAVMYDDPQDACEALAEAANNKGGPDNITSIIVDWRGYQRGRFPIPLPDSGEPDRQHSEKLTKSMYTIYEHFEWLLSGSKESEQEPHDKAEEATKLRLGKNTYEAYQTKYPNLKPLHIYHQAVTDPEGNWRLTYETLKQETELLMNSVINGSVNMSPLLAKSDVQFIFKLYWDSLINVEQRYFNLCARKTMLQSGKAVARLIEHMTNATRTIGGVSKMLPELTIDFLK